MCFVTVQKVTVAFKIRLQGQLRVIRLDHLLGQFFQFLCLRQLLVLKALHFVKLVEAKLLLTRPVVNSSSTSGFYRISYYPEQQQEHVPEFKLHQQLQAALLTHSYSFIY